MALRHREPLPVPYEELVGLQDKLQKDHDSVLWEGSNRRVLVARVPGEVPDFVNDLERVVERARPSDVQAADKAILVAQRGVHQVPVTALKQLVTERLGFDTRQCQMLRTQLAGRLSHTFYRAPDDPKRHLRLGVRVPCQRVADIDDDIEEALVEQIGPRLDKGFGDVHCVYLVASEDHVRLDPQRFLDDIVARWRDGARRERMRREAQAAEEAQRRKEERERLELIARLEGRYGGRVAVAPVRHAGPREETAIDQIHTTVDAIKAPRSLAMTDAEGAGAAGTVGVSQESRRAPRDEGVLPDRDAPPAPTWQKTGEPDLDALATRLADAGYELRMRPQVPGHKVDVAAERPDGYPQRVIGVTTDRLRGPHAQELLRTARALDVDIAIVVAEAAEPEAQRLIVATKVKWMRPRELEQLRL